MQFQITDIQFDCSLEDDDWTEKDQFITEETLSRSYANTIWDVDDEEDLVDAISDKTGWCVQSLNYFHIKD